MHIHHLNNKAIAVTGLPEGAYDFRIDYGSCIVLSWREPEQLADAIKLPEGKWKALHFAQSITEEQWREVVPSELIGGIGGVGMQWLYPDYERSNCDGYELATRSGHSLLKSKDLDPLLNHLILINDENHH